MAKKQGKQPVTIMLKGVPDDIHTLIVNEKSRIEIKTGRQGSNPEAIYNLIRRNNKNET